MTGTPVVDGEDRGVEYTDIDMNADSTTTIYNPGTDAAVYGVYLTVSGSTAEFDLEVTDGSSTEVLESVGGGSNLRFTDDIVLGESDSLQIDITTVEGTTQSDTCAVFRKE